MRARIGRPKNSSSPQPIAGPIRVRPASQDPGGAPSEQPQQHQPDHQGRHRHGQPPGQPACPAEPLPVDVGLHPPAFPADRCPGGHHRVVLGDVAGDVGPRAQLDASVEHDHVAVDPAGDGDRGVKGGQGSVHGAVHGGGAVEDDQVADLLALGHVGASGQHHELLAGLGVLRPGGRRQIEYEEDEESENHRPAHADHHQCVEPVSSGRAVNSTQAGTIGPMERQRTSSFKDPRASPASSTRAPRRDDQVRPWRLLEQGALEQCI